MRSVLEHPTARLADPRETPEAGGRAGPVRVAIEAAVLLFAAAACGARLLLPGGSSRAPRDPLGESLAAVDAAPTGRAALAAAAHALRLVIREGERAGWSARAGGDAASRPLVARLESIEARLYGGDLAADSGDSDQRGDRADRAEAAAAADEARAAVRRLSGGGRS